MKKLSVRLPDSLHRQLKELAEKEGISINQFVSSAVGEKVAALMTVEYLTDRGRRGSREKFEAVLSKVPSQERFRARAALGSPAEGLQLLDELDSNE